ncbi:MAG: glycosyl hydrolase, partial [Hominimerdicola sp.]
MKSKRMMAGALAVLTVFSGVCLPNSSVFSANALAEKYEAEDAVLSEVTIINDEDYSGGKYVKFESTGSCTFTVEISETGLYDLNLYSYGCGGDKVNLCYVDGENMGEFTSEKGTYSKAVVSNVGLTAGTHEISIQSSWGWIYFDYMEITESEGISDSVYNVSKELVNQKATESTQRLYSYLCDVYGEKIITGQQCDDGLNGSEFNAVKSLTGKTPAILGLDLMNYSPSRVELGASSDAVEKAIEFSDAGGIVTFCWHWNAPSDYLKSGTNNGNPRWWSGFYTENVDTDSMNLEEMLNGNDKYGYYFLCDEVDAIAEQLKKLQDADVPVLFRPLHEASGGWFWWGAYGAETYKKLWNFVYDRLTNKHGLNNLIWVWNGQDPDWYPGDETVDIIGEDIYPGNQVYNPQSSKFAELTKYSQSNKLIAMTENGCLFNIDQAFSNNTKWSWFCTWSGDFSASSEEYTENDMWVDVYQNENAVTLESLPDLKTYPMDAEKVSLSDDSIDIKITEQSFDYTGSKIKPKLIVEKDGTALVSGEDYTVTYKDNINVGNGKVIVKGIGKYTGTITLTFIIQEAEITDIADCEIILANNSLEYTGYAQKPKVTVKAGEKVLTSGTDYVVRYFDNTEVGTASVKIAGRGDYSGSQIVNFEITESAYTPLSKCDITLSKTKYLYTGSIIKPRVTIKNGSTVLVQNTDYVMRYVNNIEAGTASVVIAGRGSYTGSVTKYFTIEPLGTIDITQCTVTLSKTKYVYSGNANKPKVTVKDGSTTLTANTDYVLRYQDNIEVGTASVIIAGRGDYTGSITKTFEIVGNTKNISDCTITLSSYTEKYTGEPITPQVTVKYNGTNLVESVDYKVAYSDNVEIGTATITITGMGDYTGTEIKTFEITEPSTAQIEKIVNLWGNSLTAGNQDGTGITIATTLQDC